MSRAKPITHFALVLTDEGERFINLGSAYPEWRQATAGSVAEMLAQIYPDSTVHFSYHPTLDQAGVKLIDRLLADFAAGHRWLEESQGFLVHNGAWYEVPTTVEVNG